MIDLDATGLMRQAPWTVQTYLTAAIEGIDEAFATKGYASKHPELVAAYIQACAKDFGDTLLVGAIEGIRDTISQHLYRMGERS
jgi:hypothetical protein